MRFLSVSIKFFIFSFISFILIMVSLYIYAYLSPQIDLKTPGNLYIYDNNDNLVYQGSKTSEWAKLDDISDYLIDATISVEDKNFYNHSGFDYLRIVSALLANIESMSINSGGSTITQQYAKNMYLDFNQTMERKIEEAFLTLELEVHYEKDEILEGYLNTIYYGHGNYGIENASKFYFNKSSADLTLEEAIMLAGIPNRPNDYNPLTDYETSVNRAKIVAKTMLQNDLITEEIYNSLYTNTLEIYGKHTSNDLQMLMYYQDAVLDELYSLKEIPTSLIDSGGLKIYTTLDMNAQRTLEENILENLPNDEIEVAGIVADPQTGGVMALTGGVDYSESTYNRAIIAERQVGSVMKPFLYYSALENNMTMASTFKSEYTTFTLSNDNTYSPSNYNNKYANKDITMAAALAFSDNIYAVKTNLFLGLDKLVETAKLTGITGDLDEVASLALGTSELTLLDITNGYTTFAAEGYKRELYFIEKIEDMNGNVLYEKEVYNDLVLNPNLTYILNEMLACTTSDKFNDYTIATGVSISEMLTNKYALKSGTTDTDNLHIGYNQDLIVSLWMGYDDNSDTNSFISQKERLIWANTMEDLLENKNTSWYDKPTNVIGVMLDAVTGEAPVDQDSSTIFYFLKGTEPGASSFVSTE